MPRIREDLLEKFELEGGKDEISYNLLMSSIDARACYKPYEKVSSIEDAYICIVEVDRNRDGDKERERRTFHTPTVCIRTFAHD